MDKIAFLFPYLLVGLPLLASFYFSKVGWEELEENYLSEETFIGERIGIISALVGNIRHKNSIILSFNQSGLYLKPIIFFRLFQKPVLIPWGYVEEVRSKKFLFYTYKELVIESSRSVVIIYVKENAFKKMEPQLGHLAIS
jgi:hypothetical protein